MDNRMYQVRNDYMIQNVAGQNLVVPVRMESVTYCGVLEINEYDRCLWEELKAGTSQQEMEQKLIRNYRITKQEAEKIVKQFLELLRTRNILNETEKHCCETCRYPQLCNSCPLNWKSEQTASRSHMTS